MPMRILVTGSSGYIASRLLDPLTKRGNKVRGVDRCTPGTNIPNDFLHGDLNDPAIIANALDGIDTVFHLAAAKDDWGLSEEEYFRDNFEVTRRLINTGRRQGIKRWVFFSTVSVMGPSDTPLDEHAPSAPMIPYGRSKAEAEKLFRDLAAADPDTQVLIIRPSVVYGPLHPSSTNVYRLVEAIRKKRFLMIGNGAALKTTSYIDNLLAATMFLVDRMKMGLQTYIYVDEPVISTAILVRRIYHLLGMKPPAWRLPLRLAAPLASVSDVVGATLKIDFPITSARVRKFCTFTNCDGSAIRRLGFQQPISNEEALAATVTWHLAEEQR